MIAKEKTVQFLAAYNQQLNLLNGKIDDTAARLADLSLEIRFIQEKEIPEAVERRVLTGDRSQENKVRKNLDKLQKEHQEKSEDLIVIQNALSRYHQTAADEIRPINRLFQEEKGLSTNETYDRLTAARTAYIDALRNTEILHEYREIEKQLHEIEVKADRKNYSAPEFPIDQIRLIALSVQPQEVIQILKRL